MNYDKTFVIMWFQSYNTKCTTIKLMLHECTCMLLGAFKVMIHNVLQSNLYYVMRWFQSYDTKCTIIKLMLLGCFKVMIKMYYNKTYVLGGFKVMVPNAVQYNRCYVVLCYVINMWF